MFEEGGYAVNPGKPITDIGEISEIQRLALNIIKTEDRSTDKVFLDVTANPASGFGISAVKVPAALQALAHAALGSDPAAVAAQNAAITEDALTKAESFLDSVPTQNYENAVKICDPDKVPEEKIAALCIVFEEGSYRMKNTKPLMTTAVGDDAVRFSARRGGGRGLTRPCGGRRGARPAACSGR